MARIVPANKYIRKGVDEGEYADAGTTENLRQLRRRVQGTAEKGLGAASRRQTPFPTLPTRGREEKVRRRLSRPAPVIGLESSGHWAADSKRPVSRGAGEVGWYRERKPPVPGDEGFLCFSEVLMTIREFKIIESTLHEGVQFASPTSRPPRTA